LIYTKIFPPPKVIELFNNHPILKGVFPTGADAEPSETKPIETAEDMRSVTETFRKGLRLLSEEQGIHAPRLTGEAKKSIEIIRQIQNELVKTRVEISDKEYFGLPPGARRLDAPTLLMFGVTLAEINGKQKIVWAQFFRFFR
jgi:hypothetical protein